MKQFLYPIVICVMLLYAVHTLNMIYTWHFQNKHFNNNIYIKTCLQTTVHGLQAANVSCIHIFSNDNE